MRLAREPTRGPLGSSPWSVDPRDPARVDPTRKDRLDDPAKRASTHDIHVMVTATVSTPTRTLASYLATNRGRFDTPSQ